MNSHVFASLDDLVERTLRAFDGEPMVFFLGAGASAASPSFMPQPAEIQAAVFESVAPDASDDDRDLIANSLPEIYHEVLLEVGGPITRKIWRVLALWESPTEAPALSRFELGPNLVHQLVVYLAWKLGKPVVTVNFDQMLERAATSLGLASDPQLAAKPEGDSVAIWKLHGTVDDLPSIRTTVQGITAVDKGILARVEHEFVASTGCLIGYTGRDIDFFPFLCGWRLPGRVWWLSLDLDGTAIDRFPPAFIGVDARAEHWAQRVIERMPVTDPIAERLRAQLNRAHPPAGEVKDAYRALLSDYARRVYATTFPPADPKRLLAHAMALAAIGRNLDADRWTSRFLATTASVPPALSCRAQLLRSAMAHEFARYSDSRAHAKAALSLARRERLRSEADEATLRIDEAQRMLFVPPRLPWARAQSLLRPRSISVVLAMMFDALRLWRRRKPSGRSVVADYADLRASFEYLEHLIRVGAVFQGWIERLVPVAVAHRICDRYWRWIENRSYLTGYAMGIGNARKYQLRGRASDQPTPVPFSVLDLYELVPSPTGTCIHYRDAAETLASELATMPTGPTHDRKLESALKHYAAALEAAQQAGDPSLELKTMLGIRELDPERTWPDEIVKDLVGRVQSPAFKRYESHLVASLGSR
ncbi:MAG: hypothetical protein ACOYD4_06960 [Solirubrobacterales bacterium]